MSYRYLDVRRSGATERVTLNRPEVRNAFNADVIGELHDWARGVATDRRVRAIVLAGAGKAFSAGADLAWMASGLDRDRTAIVEESRALHDMLWALDRLPQPLIGCVQGAAIAGGAGLVAVCDVVIAARDAQFGFSEVRLGLVPAIISPFVVGKIGASAARALFVTGGRIDADRACTLGLVHRVVAADGLDAAVDECVNEVLLAAPGAIDHVKSLLREIDGRSPDAAVDVTVAYVTARRLSDEGRAGVSAFLSRQAPPWVAAPGESR